ncbi:MAG TPA: type I methionyl aminopeptidase [Actinomycetota bacterium]|nr:type I methionyl aminopeptidase [Actinomycetota bacterium]
MIQKKTPDQILKMLTAGQALAEVIAELAGAVAPGMTLLDLDAMAEKLIRDRGAIPSFLGYRGFPGSICASPNKVIVHGIPDGTVLANGDVLSVDVGLILDGWHADSAHTYPVGQISAKASKLLEVTKESLDAGIAQCQPGKRLTDISHAVQRVVERAGFAVVREFVGHGIGRELHEDPQIPNFGPPGRGPLIEPGMVFAIEPMVNVGGWRTRTLDDGWTVITADGSLSAHFEHTVAITPEGPLVLTRAPRAPAAQSAVGR